MIKSSKSAIAIALSFLCLLSKDKIEIHHNDDQAPGFGMCEHGCGNKDHHLMPRGDEKLTSLRDNAFKISEAKPNNQRANFRDGVEEHISSSWGSAIEQKILSNLVYPKRLEICS